VPTRTQTIGRLPFGLAAASASGSWAGRLTYLPEAIAGMEALAKTDCATRFPQHGIQQDVRAGMAVSYPGRAG